MTFNRSRLRAVSFFFLLEIFFNISFPTMSLALTAGPTVPEATSFEPIDTTDIVDLKTGDFNYNIPMLEVPGPAGSYPLSLSYHAGIQPDQEASWTGLGWTLNPGSIFRMVNGYPDDYKGITSLSRTYWSGGVTTVKSVDVSVGISNVASVTAGLSFANDTYRGRGTGVYLGAGYGEKDSPFSGDIGIQFKPYGGVALSVGGGLALGRAGINADHLGNVGINFSTDMIAGVGAGIGNAANGRSALGASISTSSATPSFSVSGGSAAATVFNGNQNRLSTNSESEYASIPVFGVLTIRLARTYMRYWVDETVGTSTYGSLYIGGLTPSTSVAYDTYDLLDAGVSGKNDETEKVLGGSFPDVDMYTVMAQGVGGNIQPNHFRQFLHSQQKEEQTEDSVIRHSKSYQLNSEPFQNKAQFRFVNDFSNRFEYIPGNFTVGTNSISYGFTNNSSNLTTGETGSEYFNQSENRLAGSKDVRWWSNREILLAVSGVDPYSKGFINCNAEGFSRIGDDKIGGFSITNASGVTYHFALPAYSHHEYAKSENNFLHQAEDGQSFNELKKDEPYAYTWYLTSVTGPDFIDRNSNGVADHGDWGYWVDFSYKKHLDDYQWRNPAEGVIHDLDGDYVNLSYGKKEIYYLDKITTETHVASFTTSGRLDGREVLTQLKGGFEVEITKDPSCTSGCISPCQARFCPNGCSGQDLINYNECRTNCELACPNLPYSVSRGVQKLDRIGLYNYSDFKSGNVTNEYLLKAIDFEYDNTLAWGTPNSYATTSPTVERGKLTLRGIKFLGKRGMSLIPKMTFDYANNVNYHKDKRDVWGFYKSDYFDDGESNGILGRLTTSTSAATVDAWSLNKITTAIGAQINIAYESDTYSNCVLGNADIVRIKSVEVNPSNKLKIKFWEPLDLNQYFPETALIRLDLLGAYKTTSSGATSVVSEKPDHAFNNVGVTGYSSIHFTGNGTVDHVDVPGNYILVNDPVLYDQLMNQTKTIERFDDWGTTLPYKVTFTYSGIKAWPAFFPAGTASSTKESYYGGGIRVKSITIDNLDNTKRITSYSYKYGTTSYEPYEILAPKLHPDFLTAVHDLIEPVKNLVYRGEEGVLTDTRREYKEAVTGRVAKQLSIARQLPGPGVFYGEVTLREYNVTADGEKHQIPAKTVYEFETYKIDMVKMDYGPVTSQQMNGNSGTFGFSRLNYRTVTLKDRSSSLGNLKTITLIDTITNLAVSKTTNHFLNDDLTQFESKLATDFKNQGLVEETYARAHIERYEKFGPRPYPIGSEPLTFPSFQRHLLAVISQRKTYPVIATGQTNENYKTGISTTSTNLAFDFYSGDATKVRTTDSYGGKYISLNVPAYRKYPAMGLKGENESNKNMLSQAAEKYSFVVNASDEPTGLLNGNIDTWSDQGQLVDQPDPTAGIWRPHRSFRWVGDQSLQADGSYPYSDFNSKRFDYGTDAANTSWEKISEVTLFDPMSHLLEASDINNNFASVRTNKSMDKVIVSSSSRYGEMASSGSEFYAGNSDLEGGVLRGDGVPSKAQSHTGQYSLLVEVGKKGFAYTLSPEFADVNKKYRASVWVYAPGTSETQSGLDKIELYYTINGQTTSVHPFIQKNKSKSWYLLSIDIAPTSGNINDISVGVRNGTDRGVYFDDFRVHPLNSQLTSYVYDPFSGELTHILDGNNFYTKFEYDAMGRLTRTSKELLNFDFGTGKESFRADLIVNENVYNYGKNN